MLLDGALREMDVELQQLATDSLRTPELVVSGHLLDQVNDMLGDPRLVALRLGLPAPEELESLTVPAQSFSVTISSGARIRHDTSSGATPGASPTGNTQVRVQVTAYASLLSRLTEYRDGTAVPLMIMMDDPDGKAFGFTMGAVEWDTGNLPTAGPDQDAIITVSGIATLMEKQVGLTGDEDYTIKMHRFV